MLLILMNVFDLWVNGPTILPIHIWQLPFSAFGESSVAMRLKCQPLQWQADNMSRCLIIIWLAANLFNMRTNCAQHAHFMSNRYRYRSNHHKTMLLWVMHDICAEAINRWLAKKKNTSSSQCAECYRKCSHTHIKYVENAILFQYEMTLILTNHKILRNKFRSIRFDRRLIIITDEQFLRVSLWLCSQADTSARWFEQQEGKKQKKLKAMQIASKLPITITERHTNCQQHNIKMKEMTK